MKVSGRFLMLAALSVAPLQAQVTVELAQDQQQFLQGESLPVAVRITNRSGQTLHFGQDDDWLGFTIEAREGRVVSQMLDIPVKGEFELESSQIATKRVDLARYFAPMSPGHYGITATVHVKDWNREINSAPKFFDVIEGTKLWEQEIGIPLAPGVTNAEPEIRRFMLQQANYLRGQIRLYLRVTDSYGRTYQVFPVGPMVSFSHPEPQVDKHSHLHVLYQCGPATFSYTSYDIEGTLLTRSYYDYVGTKPRLKLKDDGSIYVFGGQRRYTESDIPPSAPEDTLLPVSTNDPPAAPAAVPPKKKK